MGVRRTDSKSNIQKYSFKPGQSGNPGGRPKGSRNKISQAFMDDFLANWEAGGVDAIEHCRRKDPAAYLRICASLLPKNLNPKDDERVLDKFLEQYSAEELSQLLAGIKALDINKNKK